MNPHERLREAAKAVKHTCTSWGVAARDGELRVMSGRNRADAMRQAIWFGPTYEGWREMLRPLGDDRSLNTWERKAWKRLYRNSKYRVVRVTHIHVGKL